MLSLQAGAWAHGIQVAGRLDPGKLDVGGRKAGECADGKKSGPHTAPRI